MAKFVCPFLIPKSKADIVAIRYLIGIGCFYYILRVLLEGQVNDD